MDWPHATETSLEHHPAENYVGTRREMLDPAGKREEGKTTIPPYSWHRDLDAEFRAMELAREDSPEP